NHLGNFYSWYTGDFDKNKDSFKALCVDNDIKPNDSRFAIDLGAGNGIQTIALADLGFKVKAIDFNRQLIDELKSRIGKLPIDVFNDDIKNVGKYSTPKPELIVCCGDTLTHLDSFAEIEKLIKDSFDILIPNGRLILTFRDYSAELAYTNTLNTVKSDSQRILTCFIEFFVDKLRVTDLLHEFDNGNWILKVSSYYKTRISRDLILGYLSASGFKIIFDNVANRMITIIGQKN
ncbi:MAG: methyltransferase domain-containing protein, partial [Bacteroidales bacterium]|nr:methyltransferase domain-containing protein [Bacteroidales bacterium]